MQNTQKETVLDISFKRMSLRAAGRESANFKITKSSTYVPLKKLLAPSSLISVFLNFYVYRKTETQTFTHIHL